MFCGCWDKKTCVATTARPRTPVVSCRTARRQSMRTRASTRCSRARAMEVRSQYCQAPVVTKSQRDRAFTSIDQSKKHHRTRNRHRLSSPRRRHPRPLLTQRSPGEPMCGRTAAHFHLELTISFCRSGPPANRTLFGRFLHEARLSSSDPMLLLQLAGHSHLVPEEWVISVVTKLSLVLVVEFVATCWSGFSGGLNERAKGFFYFFSRKSTCTHTCER